MTDKVPPKYVADLFGVDVNTVRRWISAGAFKTAVRTFGGVNRQGHFKIDKAEVDQLWAANAVTSPGSTSETTGSTTPIGTTIPPVRRDDWPKPSAVKSPR